MKYAGKYKCCVYHKDEAITCHAKNLAQGGERFEGVERIQENGRLKDCYPILITNGPTYAPWELLPYE